MSPDPSPRMSDKGPSQAAEAINGDVRCQQAPIASLRRSFADSAPSSPHLIRKMFDKMSATGGRGDKW